MLVGGHGDANPNTNWCQSKGFWFSYCLGLISFHVILLSVPFLSVPVAWTATNVFHNFVQFIFLHTLKGTPWLSQDQGECRRLTHWEQIDNGLQFTKTKKFLSVMPVVLKQLKTKESGDNCICQGNLPMGRVPNDDCDEYFHKKLSMTSSF